MKISQELLDSVINGSMESLYNIFITLKEDYKEFNEDYERVRWGTKVKFPIHFLWDGSNRIIPKYKKEILLIKYKPVSEDDFITEKEERRRIMVNAIMLCSEEEDIYQSRE